MCAAFLPNMAAEFSESDDEEEDFDGFDPDDFPLIYFANRREDSDIEVEVLSEDEEPVPEENIASDDDDDEGEEEFGWTTMTERLEFEQFTADFGPQHNLPDNAKAIEYFQLFFPDQLINLMKEYTEKYAALRIAEKRAAGKEEPDFATSMQELKAYISLNILMGIHRLPAIWCYWSSSKFIGVEGFKF